MDATEGSAEGVLEGITPATNKRKRTDTNAHNACREPGCPKHASFNVCGDFRAIFCRTHATADMMPVINPVCQADDCTKTSRFNTPGNKLALYCDEHAWSTMVNVLTSDEHASPTESNVLTGDDTPASPTAISFRSRQCPVTGCTRPPKFNLPGSRLALFCAQHASPTMIDVLIEVDGSLESPMLSASSEKGSDHALHHTIPVENTRCETSACPKRRQEHIRSDTAIAKRHWCQFSGCPNPPSRNLPGETHPLYCVDHASVDMISVIGARCRATGCPKRPSFNFPRESRAIFCKDHVSPGMVHVHSMKCRTSGCPKRPRYNVMGMTRALYCREHKSPDMVNVSNRSRRCQEPGCLTMANFNVRGEAKPRFCASHASLDMIDVVNKRCQAPSCPAHVVFGFPGCTPTRCSLHREENLINNPRRKCQYCTTPATYGLGRPTHCDTHQTPEMQCFLQTRCAKCQLLNIVDQSDGMCSACSTFFTRRCYLRKQRYVKQWLESSTLPRIDTYDRPIEDGKCGKERPDFHWETPTHHVFLEVDEHQHRERLPECEEVRMKNITHAGGMAAVWVRYNPDEYKGDQLNEREKRQRLCEVLEKALEMTPTGPDDFCRVAYLLYDGFRRTEPLAFRRIRLM